ncbi:hypothetical protein V8O11_10635 [Erwinia aphidicola]|uniref:glycosyltransferase family 9 protein n=1 Tax=Erwinia aphidicola TaxID=68334 RepID=UPI00300D1D4C
MDISIRLANSLGCSVAGTAVVHSIYEKFKGENISVYTKFPGLLSGIEGIDVVTAVTELDDFFDVDLRKYTERRPHNSFPYRPSFYHMLEMAEEQLKCTLPICNPKIIIQPEEIKIAREKVARYTKPVVWLQTISKSFNRNWPAENWSQLTEFLKSKCIFIDLSKAEYSLRESLAVTTQCYAGICLDSFLIHGSAAVGAQNVITILGSSRPQVVTYPGQSLCYSSSSCEAQPCGMHGYYRGCSAVFDNHFNNNLCIHQSPICMEGVSFQQVVGKLTKILSGFKVKTT